MFCIIENRKIRFELEINRFLTLIQGYSGTGKTYLCKMIQEREILNTRIICEKPVITIVKEMSLDNSWFKKNSGCLLFVDEAVTKLINHKFVSLARKYNCWVVICARDVFRFGCQYAVDSCRLVLEESDGVIRSRKQPLTCGIS